MRTQVKICGITNQADAQKSCELGADFLGLIFVKSSARSVDEAEAMRIAPLAQRVGVKLVGVFQDETAEEIERLIELVGLDFVQCHGSETPKFCASLSRPVIKAIEIDFSKSSGTNDLIRHTDECRMEGTAAIVHDLLLSTKSFSENVQYFLFDKPKRPSSALAPEFDWLSAAVQTVNQLNLSTPFFFAGGLSDANVSHPLDQLRPFAVDVASGVESAPGKKDFAKLERFFEQVNTFNANAGAKSR